MKTYLILYTKDETQQIVERIKAFPGFAHVKNRVWCISTELKTSSEVRDRFKDIIGSNDLLMILDISQSPWAAINLPSNVVYWLKDRK